MLGEFGCVSQLAEIEILMPSADQSRGPFDPLTIRPMPKITNSHPKKVNIHSQPDCCRSHPSFCMVSLPELVICDETGNHGPSAVAAVRADLFSVHSPFSPTAR